MCDRRAHGAHAQSDATGRLALESVWLPTIRREVRRQLDVSHAVCETSGGGAVLEPCWCSGGIQDGRVSLGRNSKLSLRRASS